MFVLRHEFNGGVVLEGIDVLAKGLLDMSRVLIHSESSDPCVSDLSKITDEAYKDVKCLTLLLKEIHPPIVSRHVLVHDIITVPFVGWY